MNMCTYTHILIYVHFMYMEVHGAGEEGAAQLQDGQGPHPRGGAWGGVDLHLTDAGRKNEGFCLLGTGSRTRAAGTSVAASGRRSVVLPAALLLPGAEEVQEVLAALILEAVQAREDLVIIYILRIDILPPGC